MKITLTKAQIEWCAEWYKWLPPTERQRFATALEADEDLGRCLQAAAQRGHLTHCDLVVVARWKYPGPILQRLVAENCEEKIREITAAALDADTEEQPRIKGLLDLRGVGWPMASTILHFVFPRCYPILDERAMRTVGSNNTYSFKKWKEYTELCRETADRCGVTLRDLDRALWTYDYLPTLLDSGPQLLRQLLVGSRLIHMAKRDERVQAILHRIVSEDE